MGFINIGCPTGELTEDSIKSHLRVYFSQWVRTFNYDNYTANIFNSEIAIRNQIDLELLRYDQKKYFNKKSKIKNDYVSAELIGAGYLIEWTKEAFKYLGNEDSHLDFFGYKQWFESYDPDNISTRIANLKDAKPLITSKFSSVFNKLDSLPNEKAMYFLAVMFLDLVNIQDFLNSEFVPLPQKKKSNFEQDYKTLKDLFAYPETYEDCLKILREVDPPVINIENKYIGKEKGAAVLWVDILKKNNLIKTLSDDKTYAKLIGKAFDFPISHETFKKRSIRAVDRYERDFNDLLSKVYQGVK